MSRTFVLKIPHSGGDVAELQQDLDARYGTVDVTDYERVNSALEKNPHEPGLVWTGPVIGDVVHFSATGH